MNFLDFLSGLLRLIWNLAHWRWNLGFWAGFILGLIVAAAIPQEPLRWIVGGGVFLTCAVVGWWWDARAQ